MENGVKGKIRKLYKRRAVATDLHNMPGTEMPMNELNFPH
jgi:hypothetical protein